MQPTATLLSYAEWIGAAQGLFLGLLLLRMGRTYANALLAALLLAVSLLLGWVALHDAGLLERYPDLLVGGSVLPLLVGPLLYLYVRAVVGQDGRWQLRHLFHFLPFAAYQLALLPFYLRSAEAKAGFAARHHEHAHLDIWAQLPLLQFFAYAAAVLLLIRRHDQHLRNYFSDLERRQLTWLRNLVVGTAAIWLAFAVLNLAWGVHRAGALFGPLLAAAVYYVAYRRIREPQLFEAAKQPAAQPPARVEAEMPEVGPEALAGSESNPPPAAAPVRGKYGRSDFVHEQAATYRTQLRKLMEADHLYQQEGLTAKQVADGVGISTHHLSQLLNQVMETNFFDFVNHYRVAEVKREMRNPAKRHLTLLALALEAGFRSKAAFNAAFKKNTGSTPSAYKKQPLPDELDRRGEGVEGLV
ncbi:helix-turn-helix domain-containing protein [Hymenobacter sp.]|uniref:helix-turn-helix domain-containing protein n=1 Tax=Hymenobacter sp. TaxID=1898978 RepID=UPI00286AE8C0|nr:helix-turn-helix domain-containing protein [Hymenobacter sp.]